MEIIVNGKPETLPDNATAEDLITRHDLAEQACAVEVNKVLVPKKRRSEHILKEGDRVEIVTLVGGG
jgi:sulfur carrier protein